MNVVHILAVPGGGTCPHPCDRQEPDSWVSYKMQQLTPAVSKQADADGTLELMATLRYCPSFKTQCHRA